MLPPFLLSSSQAVEKMAVENKIAATANLFIIECLVILSVLFVSFDEASCVPAKKPEPEELIVNLNNLHTYFDSRLNNRGK